MPVHLDYPYHFDGRNRTASTTEADHIRDMIEQILFTAPGERVNRPDFGAGVLQLVFGPASPEAAATAEMLITGSIQRYLGQRITLAGVTTTAEDSTLRIRIAYQLNSTGEQVVEEFERGLGP